MASIGHVAVAAALSRRHHPEARTDTYLRWVLWFSVFSMLPDADVLGFPLGISYASAWGHRGATHSVAFALCMWPVAYALMRFLPANQRPCMPDAYANSAQTGARRFATCATLATLSHTFLDAFTDGGLGVALLYPLSDTRYFAPWRPLPVAPLGRALFKTAGLTLLANEAFLFLPFWIIGLWRKRT